MDEDSTSIILDDILCGRETKLPTIRAGSSSSLSQCSSGGIGTCIEKVILSTNNTNKDQNYHHDDDKKRTTRKTKKLIIRPNKIFKKQFSMKRYSSGHDKKMRGISSNDNKDKHKNYRRGSLPCNVIMTASEGVKEKKGKKSFEQYFIRMCESMPSLTIYCGSADEDNNSNLKNEEKGNKNIHEEAQPQVASRSPLVSLDLRASTATTISNCSEKMTQIFNESQTYGKIATVQITNGQYEEAKQTLLKCLRKKEQLYGPKCLESIEIYLRLCELLWNNEWDSDNHCKVPSIRTSEKSASTVDDDKKKITEMDSPNLLVGTDFLLLSRDDDDVAPMKILEEILQYCQLALDIAGNNTRHVEDSSRAQLLLIRAKACIRISKVCIRTSKFDTKREDDDDLLTQAREDLKQIINLVIKLRRRLNGSSNSPEDLLFGLGKGSSTMFFIVSLMVTIGRIQVMERQNFVDAKITLHNALDFKQVLFNFSTSFCDEAETLFLLGYTYETDGKYHHATKLYQQSRDILADQVGGAHHYAQEIQVFYHLAYCLDRMKEYKKSYDTYRRAIDVMTKEVYYSISKCSANEVLNKKSSSNNHQYGIYAAMTIERMKDILFVANAVENLFGNWGQQQRVVDFCKTLFTFAMDVDKRISSLIFVGPNVLIPNIMNDSDTKLIQSSPVSVTKMKLTMNESHNSTDDGKSSAKNSRTYSQMNQQISCSIDTFTLTILRKLLLAYCSIGMELIEQGRASIDKVKVHCREAREILETAKRSCNLHAEVCMPYLRLSKLLYKTGNLLMESSGYSCEKYSSLDAMKYYKETLDIVVVQKKVTEFSNEENAWRNDKNQEEQILLIQEHFHKCYNKIQKIEEESDDVHSSFTIQDFIDTLTHMGNIYISNAQYHQALVCFDFVIYVLEKSSSSRSQADTTSRVSFERSYKIKSLHIHYGRGRALTALHSFEEAEKVLEFVIFERRQEQPMDKLALSYALNEMGNLQLLIQRYRKGHDLAAPYYEESAKLKVEFFGDQCHPEVVGTFRNHALGLVQSGKSNSALEVLQDIVLKPLQRTQLQNKRGNDERCTSSNVMLDIQIALTFDLISNIYATKKQFDKCLMYTQEALTLRLLHLEETNEIVLKTKITLTRHLINVGSLRKATAQFEDVQRVINDGNLSEENSPLKLQLADVERRLASRKASNADNKRVFRMLCIPMHGSRI